MVLVFIAGNKNNIVGMSSSGMFISNFRKIDPLVQKLKRGTYKQYDLMSLLFSFYGRKVS
jgi:hypothetical protein